MSNKTENTNQLESDGKNRVVLLIIAITVVVVVAVSYALIKRNAVPDVQTGAAIVAAPELQRVPGMEGEDRELSKLQDQFEKEKYSEAYRTGKSSVPTIASSEYTGTLGDFADDEKSKADAAGANDAACDVESLTAARAAGVSASELRCKGCSVEALKPLALPLVSCVMQLSTFRTARRWF